MAVTALHGPTRLRKSPAKRPAKGRSEEVIASISYDRCL